MGVWTFLAPRLAKLLPDDVKLTYTGRPEAASPSEGKKTSHDREQARIVAEAYGIASAPPVAPAPTGGDGVSVKESAASANSGGANKANRNGAYTNGTGAKNKPSVTQVTSKSTEQRTEA